MPRMPSAARRSFQRLVGTQLMVTPAYAEKPFGHSMPICWLDRRSQYDTFHVLSRLISADDSAPIDVAEYLR